MFKKIKIGISPCPNDTYIFNSLYQKETASDDYELLFELHDIETLNQKVLKQELDIAKISTALIPYIYKDYYVLQSGGAAGFGVGPILIKKKGSIIDSSSKIFIPGKHTTANLLFDIFYTNMTNRHYTIFNKVEKHVSHEDNALGILIHERRFSYNQEELETYQDLGTLWEKKTALPLPLGCVVVSKKFPKTFAQGISKMIRTSVLMALNKEYFLNDFIIDNAQDMQKDNILKHIMLYVNLYSIRFGNIGKKSINCLVNLASSKLPNIDII